MKQVPELLNAIAVMFAAALKPTLLAFVLFVMGLAGFSSIREDVVSDQIIMISLVYGAVQSFFMIAILVGFSRLKSEEYQGMGWRYALARLGEWVNGTIIIICNLLPAPLFFFALYNLLFNLR